MGVLSLDVEGGLPVMLVRGEVVAAARGRGGVAGAPGKEAWTVNSRVDW